MEFKIHKHALCELSYAGSKDAYNSGRILKSGLAESHWPKWHQGDVYELKIRRFISYGLDHEHVQQQFVQWQNNHDEQNKNCTIHILRTANSYMKDKTEVISILY
jgi:hypothetical protein